jgi:hypothetical protein
MKDPTGKAAPPGGFKTGGWYSGYQYWNGSFAPRAGQIHPQSNQAGAGGDAPTFSSQDASFIQQERVRANQIQAPVQFSLPSTTSSSEFVTGVTAEAEQAKRDLQDTLTRQQGEIDVKIAGLREKEKETLGEVKTLTTPFREELETAERDRLFINQNFEENQVLVSELDQLLTEGNELIRQQQEVTGLAAVRNPRIQKSMDDVAARTGVIQAVINARNGQIAVAENMIDRSVAAIAGDRQDQIAYYETILNLNRQDILNLDNVSQKLAQEQLDIKKGDLARANATADYIKQLLIDPATAALMGEGGVKLTDSVQDINSKLSQATYAREVRDLSNEMTLSGAEVLVSPTGIPKDELRVLTDSKGQKHFYRVKDKADGRVGTAGERAVERVKTSISDQAINFPDVVVSYANQLTLSEIYSAYNQSAMGEKFGRPGESPNEIALLYKWARGEITENEYRAALGG